MQKWEYATVPLLVHATKQILDNWGDDGWELVALVPGPNPEQLVAYMKRAEGSHDGRADSGRRPEERLAALGLALPAVTPAAGRVRARRAHRRLRLHRRASCRWSTAELLMTGKVGAEVSVAEAAALARICALNALAAVASVSGGLSAVIRIVKVVGFVASAPDFTQPGPGHQRGQRAAAGGVRRRGPARPQRGRGGGPAARRAGRESS